MAQTSRGARVVAVVVRRFRVRPATVIAYVALTVAMSGVAYAAGTIGSADVIDNSLQSVDLRDGYAVKGVDVVNNSLTGADIADNGLTGADVNERSLTGVGRKLFYQNTAPSTTQSFTTLGTVAGYTLKASCHVAITGSVAVSVRLKGPAGDLQSEVFVWTTDVGAGGGPYAQSTSIPGNTDMGMAVISAQTGNRSREAGTFWLHSGSTLIQIELHMVADNRLSDLGRCFVYGLATRGA